MLRVQVFVFIQRIILDGWLIANGQSRWMLHVLSMTNWWGVYLVEHFSSHILCCSHWSSRSLWSYKIWFITEIGSSGSRKGWTSSSCECLTSSNTESTSFSEDHFIVDQLINNVVKRFSTIKHIDNQILFHLLFVVFDIFCERFVSFFKVHQ